MTRHAVAVDELRSKLGDRIVTSPAILRQHGTDESPLPDALPDAVAMVENDEQIAVCLEVCTRYGMPVIPFGAGTSLEGHVLALEGGLSLDLSKMDQIVAVNVDDLDTVVQAGVTRSRLNERLRADGLFFPVDPGADATLGGMAATGASGTTTVRYGAMRANVLGLKVVVPDGRIIRTAHRARKTSAGFDLTHLFVGSEGTLGVITELALRVYGIPETIGGAVCHFRTVEEAVAAVVVVLQLGIPVARIEFLDEMAMKGVNDYSGLPYPIAPTLLLEFHGTAASVRDEAEQVRRVMADSGGLDFRSTLDTTERMRLWKARHESFFASLSLRPGAGAITTDVCVPISRLGECIAESRRDVDASGLPATMVGHVGDGNFHIVLLVDREDPEEMARAEGINVRLVDRALEMGGTCTGEHGIGLRKRSSLRKELGEAVDVMRELKRTLDPAGIMNPGKVFEG
jgi:D-lactate dehydrogenase (cytochrome)